MNKSKLNKKTPDKVTEDQAKSMKNKFSQKGSWLVKRILKYKKKFFLMAVLTVVFLTIIILLIFSPAFAVNSLPKPALKEYEALTYQRKYSIDLSENKGIYVKYNQGRVFSRKNSVDLKNIPEGKQEFEIHSMREFYLFKLISKETEKVMIEFDYTAPELFDIQNIKQEYYAPQNTITFKTKELPIEINLTLDNKPTKIGFSTNTEAINTTLEPGNVPEDLTLAPCTQTKTDNDINLTAYSCVLNLPEEKEYPISLSVSDLAGNQKFLFENDSISYIAPVSLMCEGVPTTTNQKEFSKTCKVSKDGYLYEGEEKVEVKKDQKIEYKFVIPNEGESIVNIRTEDEEGREFNEEVKIILDTVAPVFTKISIPDTYIVCDYEALWENVGACEKKYQGLSKINIVFAGNEKVTGTLVTKPKLLTGTSGKGYTNDTFSLEANQEYSKTVDGSNYWGGYPNSGGIHFDVIVEITIIDSAGNKAFNTKTVKVVLKT